MEQEAERRKMERRSGRIEEKQMVGAIVEQRKYVENGYCRERKGDG